MHEAQEVRLPLAMLRGSRCSEDRQFVIETEHVDERRQILDSGLRKRRRLFEQTPSSG